MDATTAPNDPKTFVLCFDGTGNKFSGTDSDSNILKIYRMLDRSQGNQFHYYQPGIGTYVTTSSIDHTTAFTRFKSWYDKAKDSAIGTNFADHCMGGYRFLMRYYTPEDDIYFFGFSRGAYTARFLAEMLDHVGLLSAGNEELTRFAWKTFSKWQARRGGDSAKDKEKEKEMYDFMRNFRETFSRPVKRIRFLGLFDTVNSVPRFESAWMQRDKFPYTAHSTAKVIRHAVSIDERRAKFRQDLVSAANNAQIAAPEQTTRKVEKDDGDTNFPQIMVEDAHQDNTKESGPLQGKSEEIREQRLNETSEAQTSIPQSGIQGSNFNQQMLSTSSEGVQGDSTDTAPARRQSLPRIHPPRRYSDATKPQDIQEVWFAGNHSDIGGGWPKAPGEVWSLSHVPLVWMMREAEKAGLPVDAAKMSALNCCPDEIDDYGNRAPNAEKAKHFHNMFRQSGNEGFLHDTLSFGGGLPATSTLSWKIMEYLPFRRMDLKEDGSWSAIRWPLPQGETRDIPQNAQIHVTAIKRMEEDARYRPGNLIIGGGGRGVKIASKKHGIGEWEVFQNKDDPVSEVYIRSARLKQNGEMLEKMNSS